MPKRDQRALGSGDGNDDSQDETPQKTKRVMKTAGIVRKISIENFLCHDKLEIDFNEQINFIIGKNGSGKSAVLTGIVIALGERATSTCRGQKMTDFIKTGKSKAIVRVTLVNKGQGAFQPDVYGDFITVERTINASGTGGYKLLNERGNTVSKKREDLNRLLAKMNLQVDNPVCILNQETAKNFLHGNDPSDKYKLFERATQMDVICRDYFSADEDLERSKSCLKEKIDSLELLKSDLSKWKTKKEWYDSINEIHAKKAQLENMICWAQVVDYEKKADEALANRDSQRAEIEKVQQKADELKDKLTKLEEEYRMRNDGIAEKAMEVRIKREAGSNMEQEYNELKQLQTKLSAEVRQLEVERRRCLANKDILTKAIDEKKRAQGNSEWAIREEKRLAELRALEEKEVSLNAVRNVTDHQIGQLRGALAQFRNESNAARSELNRLQREYDTKIRMLNDLRKADSSSYAVFGDWVPPLLAKIEQAHFKGPKPKGPLGAYIKLRDKSWAPVVENFFGTMLHSFICSNDEDTRQLNRILDEVMGRNNFRPKVITASMTGRVHDVSNYKVQCRSDFRSKDIHCLMDMLIIDDPDVANILIDLQSIEQVLLIRNEIDAQDLLSEVNNVPQHCKSAITKEGNRYFPDPNYRSYSGRVGRVARFLQASVEDAIRNLEDEIGIAKQEVERAKMNLQGIESQVQLNQGQLSNEEKNLSQTRLQLSTIAEKKRTLESQHEPEPTDVAALEEDLLDVEQKMEKLETEQRLKTESYEELKQKVQEAKQAHMEHQKLINMLVADTDPLKDFLNNNKNKQKETKEAIEKINASIVRMQSKLSAFETEYSAAKEKAESEAVAAENLCPRMQVTKSLKSLNSELKQIQEQVLAQEKEFGSRDYVFSEYKRRLKEYERSRIEVSNSQKSLKKMIQMGKQRKSFILKFRNSIMSRTHHVFQHLLRTRHFEGAIEFSTENKTLNLIVTPPGREDASQPTPKRPRAGGKGGTDIRSLSGGERSFTTICFILALWDAIESPFRILDEFDVYMDHVNRAISMELLINEARENSGRQFIFLTPLGLEKQQIKDDMSIFKMTDPDRNRPE